MKNRHSYTLELNWIGEKGIDTIQNDRLYESKIIGKPIIKGSADATFFGDANLYNPEDLLLSALSACHMMSFLYVCRKKGIKVTSYTDNPIGELKINADGSGQFELVNLHPKVSADGVTIVDLLLLHKEAGELCFIANSCKFPVYYYPV